MKQVDQVHQAKCFIAAHEEEVAQVKAAVQQAGVWLTNRIVEIGDDFRELTAARDWCKIGGIDQAFQLLRSRSSAFVAVGLSGPFWEWIDAAGFLYDAIGTRWQHMTEETRQRSLNWAMEGAQAVIHKVPLVSALTTEVAG